MTVDRRASFATTLTSTAASTPGQVLLGLLFLAAIALFSLPGARGASSAIGAMPLWLLGMPLASLLALAAAHAFDANMSRRCNPASSAALRRRRQVPQARRRGNASPASRLPRAA